MPVMYQLVDRNDEPLKYEILSHDMRFETEFYKVRVDVGADISSSDIRMMIFLIKDAINNGTGVETTRQLLKLHDKLENMFEENALNP